MILSRLPDILRGPIVTRTVRVTIDACLAAQGDEVIRGHVEYAIRSAIELSNVRNGRGVEELARGWVRWRTETVWKFAGIPMPQRLAWWLWGRRDG